MYKLMKNNFPGSTDIIIRLDDKTFIPCVDSNTDYQAYLKWLEEGNTPQPADE